MTLNKFLAPEGPPGLELYSADKGESELCKTPTCFIEQDILPLSSVLVGSRNYLKLEYIIIISSIIIHVELKQV